MNRILLTGGFGYIGSHTASILAEKKEEFLIYDNFHNIKYKLSNLLLSHGHILNKLNVI